MIGKGKQQRGSSAIETSSLIIVHHNGNVGAQTDGIDFVTFSTRHQRQQKIFIYFLAMIGECRDLTPISNIK